MILISTKIKINKYISINTQVNKVNFLEGAIRTTTITTVYSYSGYGMENT